MELILRIFVWAIAIAALLALAGLAYQAIGSRRDLRRYPPPGRMVRVGSHRLHLHVTGEGGPTVVLDTGFPGSCLSWTYVQPEVAKFARVVSYDRAGLGWSDAGPAPRTTSRIVEELRALLRAADVPGPYVLVGHSFGSFTARLFAASYPEEVVGLVLVDPVHPNEWLEMTEQQRRALRKAAAFCRYGAWVAQFGIARMVRDLARAGAGRTARVTTTLVSAGALRGGEHMAAPAGKLPPELQPAAHSFWLRPNFYRALAGQTEALPESAAQVAAAGDLGALPLIVLAAANSKKNRLAEQESIARLSTRGTFLLAGADHWIQLEQPQLVVEAIRAVVEAARRPETAGPNPRVVSTPRV